ncbi:MAG: hypothetical protein ACLU4J_14945 [Butyricimonas paravirosa]
MENNERGQASTSLLRYDNVSTTGCTPGVGRYRPATGNDFIRRTVRTYEWKSDEVLIGDSTQGTGAWDFVGAGFSLGLLSYRVGGMIYPRCLTVENIIRRS